MFYCYSFIHAVFHIVIASSIVWLWSPVCVCLPIRMVHDAIIQEWFGLQAGERPVQVMFQQPQPLDVNVEGSIAQQCKRVMAIIEELKTDSVIKPGERALYTCPPFPPSLPFTFLFPALYYHLASFVDIIAYLPDICHPPRITILYIYCMCVLRWNIHLISCVFTSYLIFIYWCYVW